MGMTREKAIKEYVIPALMHTWNEKINKEVLEALEQDLGVDCVDRQAVLSLPRKTLRNYFGELTAEVIDVKDIMELPSVTPQNQVRPLCEDCHTKMDEVRRAYDNAMKQEPILDKVRAEIEQAKYGLVNDGLDIALNIIDKYKAESEET
jgi:hypothetical protein